MPQPYQEIIYQVDDPVATITMNRPDQLNAFTTRMLAEIRHALAEAENDERVVGIILTGSGRGFCAGMDIGSLDNMSSGSGGSGDDLSALAAAPGDPDLGENFQVALNFQIKPFDNSRINIPEDICRVWIYGDHAFDAVVFEHSVNSERVLFKYSL